MKRLEAIAKAKGVTVTTVEGGAHTKVWVGDHYETIPRHSEINEITARNIIRRTEEQS